MLHSQLISLRALLELFRAYVHDFFLQYAAHMEFESNFT